MKKTCVYFCSTVLLFPCFMSLDSVGASENVNEISVEQKSNNMRDMLQEIDKNPNVNVEIDGDDFTITFTDSVVYKSVAETQGNPLMIAPMSNGVNKIQGAISSGNFKVYLSKNTLGAVKTFGIGALGKIIPGGVGWLLAGLTSVISADKTFNHGRVFVYQNYRYQYWYNQ